MRRIILKISTDVNASRVAGHTVVLALARSGISGQMGVFARNTHTQWAPESWGEHPHLSKIVSDLTYNLLSIFLVFSHTDTGTVIFKI